MDVELKKSKGDCETDKGSKYRKQLPALGLKEQREEVGLCPGRSSQETNSDLWERGTANPLLVFLRQ